MSRYKEPRVCGLDIKRTMKIGLCWGIYEGPWFLHHEEENTTELEVDQKFYVLITKITRNNYLLVKQLSTCSEGAEAFLVIGFQYELCFRIPKLFRISQYPKNLFMNPCSLFDLACSPMWCPKSTQFLSFATGVQKVLNLSPFQQKYLPLLDHLLRHTCVISVCTLFAHFPFHQNVLSKMLDLHWSKWSVNAVWDDCQAISTRLDEDSQGGELGPSWQGWKFSSPTKCFWVHKACFFTTAPNIYHRWDRTVR